MGARSHTRLAGTAPARREAARRALARAVRRALGRRAGAATGLPAAWGQGRFADLAAVDAAARALGAEPCAWHRLYLATLPPEGLEAELATLAEAGVDRACALAGVRALARALVASGADPTLARARVAHWLGRLTSSERAARARRRLALALVAAADRGDRPGTASTLVALARLHLVAGDAHAAHACLAAAFDLAPDAARLAPATRARALCDFGLALLRTGHLEPAQRALTRSLEALAAAPAQARAAVAADARAGLGEIAMERGDMAEAYLQASAAAQAARRAGDPPRTARALVELAATALALAADADGALALLAEADALDPAGDGAFEARVLEAEARAARGERTAAEALLAAVTRRAEAAAGDRREALAARLALVRADLLARAGEGAGAYEWYRAAALAVGRASRPRAHLRGDVGRRLGAGLEASAVAARRPDEAASLRSAVAAAFAPEPLTERPARAVVAEERTRLHADADGRALRSPPAERGRRRGPAALRQP